MTISTWYPSFQKLISSIKHVIIKTLWELRVYQELLLLLSPNLKQKNWMKFHLNPRCTQTPKTHPHPPPIQTTTPPHHHQHHTSRPGILQQGASHIMISWLMTKSYHSSIVVLDPFPGREVRPHNRRHVTRSSHTWKLVKKGGGGRSVLGEVGFCLCLHLSTKEDAEKNCECREVGGVLQGVWSSKPSWYWGHKNTRFHPFVQW